MGETNVDEGKMKGKGFFPILWTSGRKQKTQMFVAKVRVLHNFDHEWSYHPRLGFT